MEVLGHLSAPFQVFCLVSNSTYCPHINRNPISISTVGSKSPSVEQYWSFSASLSLNDMRMVEKVLGVGVLRTCALPDVCQHQNEKGYLQKVILFFFCNNSHIPML